ncbi:hypothetical protein NPX13_g4907 [Xylaria arbuscula]|uniref:Uncharacterized protein n=1 Tax=Xylaria arbuscula TaxID=114810 RepID=A0A9W8TLH4_9PEZI|nr:hypothetical protein NPX13_g4907 [Xylaria arbuscula]
MSGFNPRPYQKRTESQSQSTAPAQSSGERLDSELSHDSQGNNLRTLALELTEMLEVIQGTVRLLPSAPGYTDYLEVVSSFDNVIVFIGLFRNSLDEARAKHLRNVSSAEARDAYRAVITEANAHISKLQALIRDLQSKLGLPIKTRYSSLRDAFIQSGLASTAD